MTGDLVISSQARSAAEACGVMLALARTPEELLRLTAEQAPRLVVLDLTVPGLDPVALVGQLRQLAAPPTVIAFGPHVREDQLAAAREAGCDLILSRGNFQRTATDLLRRHLA